MSASDEWRLSGGLSQQGLESLSLERRVTRYFEQWREQVYRYLIAVFGRPELAEEYTQEAFLRLYNALHSGESISNPRAWVFRVAHNLAATALREAEVAACLPARAGACRSRRRGVR